MKIQVLGHCSDCCNIQAGDIDYSGYVPKFLGGGDDIKLEIDTETGQILNWNKEKFQEFLNENSEITED